MHANHSNIPSHRKLCLLRALALASLAIAGMSLPFAWDVLASIDRMPKMGWLQQALAQVPPLSWIMMFVWGGAIPLVLLLSLQQERPHKLRTAIAMLVLMLIAVTWYAHMPLSSQCAAMYPAASFSCSALEWGYSLSLVLSLAAYAFLILGLSITALGLLAEGLEDEHGHAA